MNVDTSVTENVEFCESIAEFCGLIFTKTPPRVNLKMLYMGVLIFGVNRLPKNVSYCAE